MKNFFNNFGLLSNRFISTALTVAIAVFANSYSLFYSFFMAFAMCHFLLAFYYSGEQVRQVSRNGISLALALIISLIGLILTWSLFPRIAPIFIVHEILSEVFIPFALFQVLGFTEVVKDSGVQVWRFVAGIGGVCFIARLSGYVQLVPDKFWLGLFLFGLLGLVWKLKRDYSFLKSLSGWVEVFSFEIILTIGVVLSYIFNVTLTTAHIAFYHGFFWFFFVMINFYKFNKPGRKQFVWQHVIMMAIFWLLTPKALNLMGLIHLSQFDKMNDLYINIMLLTASVHIFASFYLSRNNPTFIRKLFYRQA